MNRNEAIAAAKSFVWNGHKIEASAALGVCLLDAHRRLVADGGELEVPLDKHVANLVLTEVEDLLDLWRTAQLELARARSVR